MNGLAVNLQSCATEPNLAEATIGVRTLGTFELVIDGRPVPRWRAGKARNLLQFLLIHRGRTISRDKLYESLWPDWAWSANSSSLKVAVHMLRQILADHHVSQVPSPVVSSLMLKTEEMGYRLEAHNVWIDFEDFEDLIDRAHALQAGADADGALALYRQAVALYRGDFLPGVHLHWAEERREWLRSRLLCALEFIIEAELAVGDRLGAITSCGQMLEADPLHERAYQALIVVHGQLGQLAQVRRWYQLCTSRLRDELDVAPDEATKALYARAVQGDLVGRRWWQR